MPLFRYHFPGKVARMLFWTKQLFGSDDPGDRFKRLCFGTPKASAFTKRDGAGLLSITPVATVWIRVRWHGPFLARRLRRLRRALLHPDLPFPVSKLHASGSFRSSAIGHCDRLHSAPFRSRSRLEMLPRR